MKVKPDTLLLLRNLVKSGRLTEARLDALLGSSELSTTRLLTLGQLEDAAEPLSLSQLASCLAFVKSNATQVVDRLEECRLVRRVPDPYDRRCTLLEITEDGRTRRAEALQTLEPLAEKLEEVFTEEEQEQLIALLQRLQQALH